MKKITECPLCSSPNLEELVKHRYTYPGDDVENNLTNITYVRLWILFEKIMKSREPVALASTSCQDCGFIFTNPALTEAEMQLKYATIFELGSVKKRSQLNPASNLDTRAERVHRLISDNFKKHGSKNPKILDYGGASGYNLLPFLDEYECALLDYEKWDLPDNIAYLGRDVADLSASAKFDVIYVGHTLEHVLNPRQLVEEMVAFLAAEGILYVEVPLGCFKEWKSMAEPLTHVNFFSEESLYKCFTACGLSVIHLSSSFQWVTHDKEWCINIIGRKTAAAAEKALKPRATKSQINRLRYYLPYFSVPKITQKLLAATR